MANTLKFGNGQWASKEGSVLAYNDENNNFKPLPFDFTRASGATRVNKDGLIEVVGSDEPRIDFSNDANGALLLEPSRTNYCTLSEDIDTWTSIEVTTEKNFLSPDGTLNAVKITDNSENSSHRVLIATTTPSSGDFTYSVFLKKGTMTNAALNVFSGATEGRAFIDLENVTISTEIGLNSKIENYGNDWYRCSISGTFGISSTNIYLYMGNNTAPYVGNGDFLYMFGAQLEQGSYATSYIPTSGASVTRVADSASQTPVSGIIGQTEGSVYVEVNISNTTSKTILALDSGSASNFIILDTTSSLSPKILVRQSSGSFPAIITGTTMSYGVNKIAFCYKSGDYAMYVNGVLSGTSTSTTFPSGIISKISVGANSSYGYLSDTVNDVKLYNTRLSNSELAALTTI
jgi:hypothetical protein